MGHNREPGIDSQKCNLLIFTKGAKAIQCRNDSIFKKWCNNDWMFICNKKKKVNPETDIIPYTNK